MGPKTLEVRFNRLPVAIVENDPQSLRGLVYSLEQLGCEITWTAKDDVEAIEAAKAKWPSVLFVDLRLLRGSDDYETGWQLIKHLYQRKAGRPFAVIIYSSTPMVDEIVLEAVRLGCSYVVKEDLWDHESEVIAGALLAARSGSVLLSNEVASGIEMIVSQMKDSDLLSEKEVEVLRLVADGLSNREIARKQFVAISTVKTHVSNILAKLDVDNRGKAADWYRQRYG